MPGVIAKEDIYRDYYDKVFGYIYSQINNVHNAEDIASDVFVKVYEKLETYDESRSSISTWIFNITRNTLTDYYRTRRVFEEMPKTLEAGDSVEDEVLNKEMLELLAEALESLGDNERNVVILHYYSGLTLKEIAEKMGLSYTYIKVIQKKALNYLKKYFEKQ